ncbi:MAG: phosphoribosylformylglycinamidine synthase subunit PurQ [Pirellulales bacterium]|nr:phosphoribosylformylglycinamidine synthase subunit PurQ [Pirellulales bacterium]
MDEIQTPFPNSRQRSAKPGFAQPRVLVLRSPGANCDEETQFAFNLAGAQAERIHVNRVLEHPAVLEDFQILCVPGGFSYGDDVSAGKILGSQLEYRLGEVLQTFRQRDTLALGICNGFQVLLKSGLLTDDGEPAPPGTLTWNTCGRYEDRWTKLRVDGGRCIFLQGMTEMEFPIAHAEGRFLPRDDATLAKMQSAGQLPLRYTSRSQGDKTGSESVPYPDNPNGSVANVAGICDITGRVFGLMPHPERFIDATQHPQWTRKFDVRDLDGLPPGDGLAIFQKAVRYFA